MNIKELQKEVHQNAKEHGWWDEPKTFGEIVALCHSELSEALEEYRKPNEIGFKGIYYSGSNGVTSSIETEQCQKPEGIATELADCIIRILDFAEWAEIDIEEIIKIKHAYNLTRPFKHGNKKI